jgi:TPR repeat protein
MYVRWCLVDILVALLLVCPGRAGDEPAEKKAALLTYNQLEELLLLGKYRDIPRSRDARGKAIWAFAAYHLAPNKEMYDAAWEAHQKGDLLGTFIVMRSHKEGRAVRRDETLCHQLNFKLRETLSKKEKCSPVELYILSQTSNAGAEGSVDYSKVDDAAKFQKAEQDQLDGWLLRAAEQGFAQAANDMGNKIQQDMEYRKAWNWYDKAAKKGLAEAWRAKGFFFMEGLGVPRNREEGYAETLEAAERGDAFAMVSLATYLENGWGTKKNPKQAAAWIEKAGQTGHWIGYLEEAQGHLRGVHGLEKDEKKALVSMRRALETRNRDVLEILTGWYVSGKGVARDGNKAVVYGEAAFIQGSGVAARYLTYIYKEGIGGVDKNEKLARYWDVQATLNVAIAVAEGLATQYPELTNRLQKIDPWEFK